MRTIAGSFAVLGIVLVCTTSAGAQFNVNPTAPGQRTMPGRLQVSGFVGGMTIEQSLGTATNIYQSVTGAATDVPFGRLYGVRVAWGFTEMLAAEFNFSGSRNAYTYNVDDVELGSVALGEQLETAQRYLGGNIVFQFPLGELAPYATAGIGLLRTTPQEAISGIDSVSGLDFNVGGGVKYWFASPKWLGIRGDVRYHTANEGLTFPGGTSTPKGFEFTVGASFRWF